MKAVVHTCIMCLMWVQCEVLFLQYRCSLFTVTIATWRIPAPIPATQCLTLAIHSEQCLHTTVKHKNTHTMQDLCHQLKQAVTEWAEWLTASFFSENQNSGSNDHTSPLLTVLEDISAPYCSVHLLMSCKTVLCFNWISGYDGCTCRATV